MAYNFVTKVILERHAHTKYTALVMYYGTLLHTYSNKLNVLQSVNRIYSEFNRGYNYRYVHSYVAHYVSLYRMIQEQKVNILGGECIGHCKKKFT